MSNQNRIAKRGAKNATRARPLPPDVTARNLAYEKQRRQSFNDDLVNLARLVPALAQARRLSKVLIINESVRHLRQRRSLCISAARDMQELRVENNRLASELNALRLQMGGPTVPPVETKPVTEAMAQLMDIENETAGEFPEGFGESWAGRSSPPSKAKVIPAQDEEVRLAHGRSHHAQSSMKDTNALPGDREPTTPAPPGQPHDAWSMDPALNHGPEPSLLTCPELFPPIESMPPEYMQTLLPEYLTEPVDATPMDPLSAPRMEDSNTVHERITSNVNDEQGKNERFEDLWDFWSGQGW